MVQLQDSISKRLHQHALPNMLFDKKLKGHHAQKNYHVPPLGRVFGL
jgi:hypothetical protein